MIYHLVKLGYENLENYLLENKLVINYMYFANQYIKVNL